jgi:hypothetical protein
MMRQIREEGMHAATQDPAWQESVFLAWRDPVRAIGGIHRIGIEVNRGVSNMWCGVFQSGGPRFRLNQDQVPLEHFPQGRGFICGPQRSFQGDQSVHWALDTPDCRVELEMEDHATGDLWTGAGLTASVQSVATLGHYHHHCAVRGRVRLGGETFEVAGDGWRDHSWGPRHWDAILHHRNVSGFFAKGMSADFGSLLDAKGTLSPFGTIVRNGVEQRLQDFTLTVAIDQDGLTARSADVVGTLPSGEPFSARVAVADGVVVQTREYVGIETVGTMTLSSGESGFGYMAVSNNPRAGRAAPPLALNALGENGFFPKPGKA